MPAHRGELGVLSIARFVWQRRLWGIGRAVRSVKVRFLWVLVASASVSHGCVARSVGGIVVVLVAARGEGGNTAVLAAERRGGEAGTSWSWFLRLKEHHCCQLCAVQMQRRGQSIYPLCRRVRRAIDERRIQDK